MKRVICTVIALVLVFTAFSFAEADFTTARGMKWGMSADEVQAIELALLAQEDEEDEHNYDYYVYYDSYREREDYEELPIDIAVVGNYKYVPFSRFNAQVRYYLADDELKAALYYVEDDMYYSSDVEYLVLALSSLYGYAETVRPAVLEELMGDSCLNDYSLNNITQACAWTSLDDTNIYMLLKMEGDYVEGCEVLYVEKAFAEQYVNTYDLSGL